MLKTTTLFLVIQMTVILELSRIVKHPFFYGNYICMRLLLKLSIAYIIRCTYLKYVHLVTFIVIKIEYVV